MIDAFKRASAGRITAVVPVLRLRPLGQEGPAARAHHGAAHRGHDQRRRRRPRADHGPAPGPDPGLLQHPGRRADRRAPAVEPLQARRTSRTWSSSPTWLRQARPHIRGAPRRAAGGHREAPPGQRRPRRAAQRHRRGAGQAGDHRRRRDRHREHADGDRPRARARGRRPRCTPAPRTASCPTRPSSDCADSQIAEIVITDTVPLPAAKQPAEIKVLLRSRRSSARPSSASTAASPWVRCSASEMELVQEMVLWDEETPRAQTTGLRLRNPRRSTLAPR